MAEPIEEHKGEQEVTPWAVSGGADGKIDYDKLIVDFGVSRITEDLVSRVERLANRPAHPFLRRGIVFAHRDLVRTSLALALPSNVTGHQVAAPQVIEGPEAQRGLSSPTLLHFYLQSLSPYLMPALLSPFVLGARSALHSMSRWNASGHVV